MLAYTVVQVSSVQFPRLKEVDDVLGGQAAWENVDTTEGEAYKTLFIVYSVITTFG